jgi:ribonuclease HI
MTYRIFSDGASKGNPGPSGAGAVILGPKGDIVHELAVPLGITTNNVAEYQGLIEALKYCRKKSFSPVEVFADSQLMIRQLQGVYKVRQAHLQTLHQEAMGLLREIGNAGLHHIPREENTEADRLANEAVAKGFR